MKSNGKEPNKWAKQTLSIFCVLYTVSTLANSILYLVNGYYKDPNGNWHELDRAFIVLIGVLSFVLIRNLESNSYFLTGLREPLAPSAFHDIFVNYTFCFGGVAAIAYVPSRIKRQRQQTGADR